MRSSRLTGGILQQLVVAADQEDEAAATAAKEAASSQGRASRLLLIDLALESDSNTDSNSHNEGQPRILAADLRSPVGLAGQGMSEVGHAVQPLCSATINYGASVGDASKKATSDVPIYVGSFDLVVTQPQVSASFPCCRAALL